MTPSEEFVAEAEHSTLGLGFRCSTITHAGCGSFRQGRRACKPARAWHGDLITVLTRCRLMGEHRQDFHLVQNTGLSIEFDFQLEQPEAWVSMVSMGVQHRLHHDLRQLLWL